MYCRRNRLYNFVCVLFLFLTFVSCVFVWGGGVLHPLSHSSHKAYVSFFVLSHFRLLLQNHLANFNNWHKAFLAKRDSILQICENKERFLKRGGCWKICWYLLKNFSKFIWSENFQLVLKISG